MDTRKLGNHRLGLGPVVEMSGLRGLLDNKRDQHRENGKRVRR